MPNPGKGQPTQKDRVLAYAKQHPGEKLTAGGVAKAVPGLSTERANQALYSLFHATGSGFTRQEIGVYMYHETPETAARIEATPDGGMRLAVPGDEAPTDAEMAAAQAAEPDVPPKPGEKWEYLGGAPKFGYALRDPEGRLYQAQRLE